MTFLYPSFLYACAAILIPIIIHLFSFRTYKTVYFSNIRFLKNIKLNTQSKSQLKHLLILLSRILAIIALVVAFAQPFIPATDSATKSNNQVVCLYVDNSFSMDAQGKYGNLLESAKNNVRSILNAYKSSTKFYFLTNDFEPKHQHLLNREQVEEFLGEIKPSPTTRNVSEVFQRQVDFIGNEHFNNKTEKITSYLLSDFQKSTSDFEKIKDDSVFNVNLIPISAQSVNNLYIDSCWFDSPVRLLNQPEQLFVKVVNKSDAKIENVPVELRINDSLKAVSSVSVERNSSEIVNLSYTNTSTGIINGVVQLSDFPITYDNNLFFNYSINDSINLLIISEQFNKKNFDALFDNDKYIRIQYFTDRNIQTSEFGKSNIIILNEIQTISTGTVQALADYVNNGGNLVFIPHAEGDIKAYNQLFNLLKTNYITQSDTVRTKIEKINYQHQIYKNVFEKINENVDLPTISNYYRFSSLTQVSDDQILTTQNKIKALSSANCGKGRIYVFAFSFNTKITNFITHRLFVPTLYNMVFYSQPVDRLYSIIGRDETIELNNVKLPGSEIFRIKNKAKNVDFVAQLIKNEIGGTLRLGIQQNIREAGNYLLENDNNMLKGLGYNYSRKESELTYFSSSEVEELIKKYNLKNFTQIETQQQLLTEKIKQLSQGRQLWKLFVLFALIFLAIEIILIRIWK